MVSGKTIALSINTAERIISLFGLLPFPPDADDNIISVLQELVDKETPSATEITLALADAAKIIRELIALPIPEEQINEVVTVLMHLFGATTPTIFAHA